MGDDDPSVVQEIFQRTLHIMNGANLTLAAHLPFPMEPVFFELWLSEHPHRSRPRLRNLIGGFVDAGRSVDVSGMSEPLGQEVWARLFRENQSYLWTATKRCRQSTKKNI